jgi:hypothetical protein
VTERRAELSEMLMSNGIASMEQYQNVMGQLSALAHVEETLKNVANRMENADNV